MESYIITFILGFLIDKISLFPFVMGFGLSTILNNNFNLKLSNLKEYIKLCKKNINIQKLKEINITKSVESFEDNNENNIEKDRDINTKQKDN